MNSFLRITCIVFSISLGLIFAYSGYAKLTPVIETFEFTFVDMGVANWYTAPVIARLLIALEFFTALLLLANYHLRKFTLPFAIAILLFFTAYLSLQVLLDGNQGNCGCFGEHLQMTPLEAILKNVCMLAAALVVYRFHAGWTLRLNALWITLAGIACCLIPFIVNPVDYAYTSNNLEEKINYPLELDLLYHPKDTARVEVPKVELRKGKYVVAFLSLTCSHCRIAAKKFRLIKKNNPDIPIYFVLNGERSDHKKFIEDTRADNIPSGFCLGRSFVQLSSAHLPRIYFLDNGMVVKKADYFELNQYEIETWLKTGKLR